MSSFSSQNSDSSRTVSLIFLCGYLCQGVAQHFCLISQPLNNFLKAGLRLDAAQVSFCVSLLMVPWVIKPIYGMVADHWQFTNEGSKRKRFLISVHLFAAAAYAGLALLLCGNWTEAKILPLVLTLVALAGVCIAFSTVIFVAMTVEHSHRDKTSARSYFGEQAVAYSVANMLAVYLGGQLCGAMSPASALSSALLGGGAVLVLACFGYARLMSRVARAGNGSSFVDAAEPAEPADPSESAATPNAADITAGKTEDTFFIRLRALLSSKPYLLTLLFLSLWNLSPNLGVSLYYYECDKLHFTQETIGQLAACTCVGTLVGSFIFRLSADFFQQGRSTYLLVAMSVAGSLSYLFLSTPLSGAAIEFCRGAITIIATLAIYGLAADVSPRNISATAMAVLIAVFNLAQEGSIALGGYLYDRVFSKELLPLIVVSSLTTLSTALLIPYLGRDGCKQDEKREQVL